MYTLLYLKWITNQDLGYSTWNSAQYYVVTCMGGELWEEWTRVCMAESLGCPPGSITALLIGYMPIQNKKYKKYAWKEREGRKQKEGNIRRIAQVRLS